MNVDIHQLKLLAISHYLMAGVLTLATAVPIAGLYFTGIMIFNQDMRDLIDEVAAAGMEATNPYLGIGLFFLTFITVTMLYLLTIAVMSLLTARFLTRQRHHRFCIITAGFQCLLVPIGTVLGVATILLLVRPEVREHFDVQ